MAGSAGCLWLVAVTMAVALRSVWLDFLQVASYLRTIHYDRLLLTSRRLSHLVFQEQLSPATILGRTVVLNSVCG